MTGEPRALRLGLLGQPASGKTTVARLLEQRGCLVLDADRLVHQAYQDPAIREEVRQRFGAQALDAQGQVLPARLAALVFRDPAARQQLEELLHPLVRRQLQEALDGAPPGRVVVLDVPLLAEGGLAAECDLFLFVECSLGVRQQRAAARGWDAAELARRDAAQLSPAEKLAAAAGKPLWRLANDGSLQDLEQVLEAAWNQIITTYPVTT